MSSTAGSVHHVAEEPRRWIDEWGPVTIFGGIPFLAAFMQAWSFTTLRKFQTDPYSIVIGLASVFALCLFANMALGRKSVWTVSILAGTFLLAVSIMLFVPNWSHPNAVILALIGLFGGAIALNARHTGWGWSKRALAIIGGDADDEVDEALLMRLRELDDADRNNGLPKHLEWNPKNDDKVVESAGGSQFSPRHAPESGVGFDPTEYVFPHKSDADSDERAETNAVEPIETETAPKRVIFGSGAEKVEVETGQINYGMGDPESFQPFSPAELDGPLTPISVFENPAEESTLVVPDPNTAPVLDVVTGTVDSHDLEIETVAFDAQASTLEYPTSLTAPKADISTPLIPAESPPDGVDDSVTASEELDTPVSSPEVPAIFAQKPVEPTLVVSENVEEPMAEVETPAVESVEESVYETDVDEAGSATYGDDELSRLRESLRKARLS